MKVLVGITTRNRAEILPKAIESALAQSYPYVEVAVIDDASDDGTPQVAARFPQVRWLRNETPQGLQENRNRLMLESDADLYLSLDDDAWFLREDEIAEGVRLFEENEKLGALAYDILSPTRTEPIARAAPVPIHMYIGCGHLLRLSAVRELGGYAPNPATYGGEEKDFCLCLLDRGYDILLVPGLHVWHDKTPLARDWHRIHRSGVCNDLAISLRRCPLPDVLVLFPGKLCNHLRFALKNGLFKPFREGFGLFLSHLPAILKRREPVRPATFREFRRREATAPRF